MNHNRPCLDDSCDLDHCPKCGGHVWGYLESFQMCNECEMDEEYKLNLNKLVCDINYQNKTVKAFRNGTLIAEISQNIDTRQSQLTLFNMAYDVSEISISMEDLSTIMDQYNQMIKRS